MHQRYQIERRIDALLDVWDHEGTTWVGECYDAAEALVRQEIAAEQAQEHADDQRLVSGLTP